MDQHTRRRRRPAISCVECRRRKIKCSRGISCAHCNSVGIQCVYRVYDDEPEIIQESQQETASGAIPNLSATPLAFPAQQTSAHALNLDYCSQPITPRVTSAVISMEAPNSNTTGARTAAKGRASALNRPEDSTPTSLDVGDLLKRVQKLEVSSASNPIHGLSETNRDILAQQSGLQDSHTILNKTRILGWSQWMGTSKEVTT